MQISRSFKFQHQEEALTEAEEGLVEVQEEASIRDEFAALKLKKKLSSKKKKGKIPLPAADLQYCLTKTSLDKPQISELHR